MASTINLKFPSLPSITTELIFLLSWLHCDATLTGCDITCDSPVWPMGSHAVKWATDCQAAGQLERILGQKGLQRKKNLHQRTFTSNHQNTGWFTEIICNRCIFCDYTCTWSRYERQPPLKHLFWTLFKSVFFKSGSQNAGVQNECCSAFKITNLHNRYEFKK